jgi:hypothetical protein
MLQVVVAFAGRVQVFGDGAGLCGPGVDVILLAAAGVPTAAVEAARAVFGDHVVAQRLRRPVPLGAAPDEPAERIGDQPVPGAGRVMCDLARQ